jgi:hypothetical protein
VAHSEVHLADIVDRMRRHPLLNQPVEMVNRVEADSVALEAVVGMEEIRGLVEEREESLVVVVVCSRQRTA